MGHIKELIVKLDRDRELDEFHAWAMNFPGTDRQAWEQCPAGEWLLWLASAAGVERAIIVRAAMACVKSCAEDLCGSSDVLLSRFISSCDAWDRGSVCTGEVRLTADILYERLTEAREQTAKTTLYDACVWTSYLVLEGDEDDDDENSAKGEESDGSPHAAPYMSLMRVAAAWARGTTEGSPGSHDWSDRLAHARARCALLVRREVPFGEIARNARLLGYVMVP